MIVVSVTMTNKSISVEHFHREQKDKQFPDQPAWQRAFRDAIRYQPAEEFYVSGLRVQEFAWEIQWLNRISHWKKVVLIDTDNTRYLVEKEKEYVYNGPPTEEEEIWDACAHNPLFSSMGCLARGDDGEDERQCVCGSWNCESYDLHLSQELGE